MRILIVINLISRTLTFYKGEINAIQC